MLDSEFKRSRPTATATLCSGSSRREGQCRTGAPGPGAEADEGA